MEAATRCRRVRPARARRRSPTCCRSPREARRQPAPALQGRATSGSTSPTTSSATIVREVALGLIALGIEPGDKVAILANTRPEWTYAVLRHPLRRRDARSRSTRPTRPRSASTCSSHSESKAVFVEDAEQLAKIREVARPAARARARDRDRAGRRRRRRRDHARRAARARPRRATRPSCEAAHRGGRRPRTSPSTSTRPAPPARPRAACSRTPTTARSLDMVERRTTSLERGRGRLPVPAARARVRAA